MSSEINVTGANTQLLNLLRLWNSCSCLSSLSLVIKHLLTTKSIKAIWKSLHPVFSILPPVKPQMYEITSISAVTLDSCMHNRKCNKILFFPMTSSWDSINTNFVVQYLFLYLSRIRSRIQMPFQSLFVLGSINYHWLLFKLRISSTPHCLKPILPQDLFCYYSQCIFSLSHAHSNIIFSSLICLMQCTWYILSEITFPQIMTFWGKKTYIRMFEAFLVMLFCGLFFPSINSTTEMMWF